MAVSADRLIKRGSGRGLAASCFPWRSVRAAELESLAVMALRISFVVLVMLVAPVKAAIADSWPKATVKAVVSENGELVVRVTPGASIGDTYGFAGAPKGKFASAQWFRFRENRYELYQTIQLVNPVAPIHVAAANDGTVVTLDNWHNVGFGDVLVIYAPDGRLRKKYRLEDLYSAATIETIKRSVSSVWWRCVGVEPYIERNGTLQIDDTLGGRFTFHLENGAYTYDAGVGGCKP